MLKRTALLEEHRALGGRLIDFGGWELPVQYSGVSDEHLACRKAAGLFDVSHMGEVEVKGPGATAFLSYLLTNQISKLAIGQAQYNVMCRENGGIVDDLVVYKRKEDLYLVVVNASNTDKDFAWMQAIAESFRKTTAASFTLENLSSQYSQIAIQGPLAAAILQRLTDTSLSTIKTYWFAEGKVCGSIPAILARTGYTGEDGFEIYVAWDQGPALWRALLEAGKPDGIKPCGLGARDTLRLEMKYPLYGQELGDDTNPLEAGLGWVVKLDKGDFVGKSALVAAKESGLKRGLVGLVLKERGIPRHGYPVYDESGEHLLGEVTSGTQSPSTQLPIGIAYVKAGHTTIGGKLRVEIRGQKLLAEIIPTPFYKKKT